MGVPRPSRGASTVAHPPNPSVRTSQPRAADQNAVARSRSVTPSTITPMSSTARLWPLASRGAAQFPGRLWLQGRIVPDDRDLGITGCVRAGVDRDAERVLAQPGAVPGHVDGRVDGRALHGEPDPVPGRPHV